MSSCVARQEGSRLEATQVEKHKASIVTKLDAPYTRLFVKLNTRAPVPDIEENEARTALPAADVPQTRLENKVNRFQDIGDVETFEQENIVLGPRALRPDNPSQKPLTSDECSLENAKPCTTSSITYREDELSSQIIPAPALFHEMIERGNPETKSTRPEHAKRGINASDVNRQDETNGKSAMRFVSQEDTSSSTLSQHEIGNYKAKPPPVQFRRYQAHRSEAVSQGDHEQSQRTKVSQLDEQPEWNVHLSEMITTPESIQPSKENLEERVEGVSQRQSQRMKKSQNLYKMIPKCTADILSVPVEGSSVIRYKASTKSQRLKDARALKQARDDFVVRKHGHGIRIRRHAVGTDDEETEQRGDSGDTAMEMKSMSAKECARQLHTKYRPSRDDSQ